MSDMISNKPTSSSIITDCFQHFVAFTDMMKQIYGSLMKRYIKSTVRWTFSSYITARYIMYINWMTIHRFKYESCNLKPVDLKCRSDSFPNQHYNNLIYVL